MEKESIFKAVVDLSTNPDSVISSSQSLSNFLLNINDIQVNDLLSFYGREVKHLYQNGYSYNILNKLFEL